MPGTEKRLTASQAFSRRDKMRIRTLYVLQGLSPKEIAEKTDFDDRQIRNLVHRQGWAAARKAAEDKAAKAEASAADKVAATAGEFIESVAQQSQELAEEGFELARDMAKAKDGIGFSAAIKGTATAVQMARQALGVDNKASAAGSRSQALALVFVELPERSEKPAEPINVTPQASEIAFDFAESQQGETGAQDEPS